MIFNFSYAFSYKFYVHSNTEFQVTDFDPCSDNYGEAYLNRPEVQLALHAKPTNWTHCR